MTSFQKVIKYLAIAFAIFLIVSIISGIIYGVRGLAFALNLKNSDTQTIGNLEEITSNIEYSKISKLDIELQYSELKIKSGDTFKIESNSNNILYDQNKNKIKIKEKNLNWFSNKNSTDLIIYIPDNMIFEDIKIVTGAGDINIQELNSEDLNLEIGAGKVNIEELNVSNKTEIEGGAGKVIISSGKMNNLKLDMGVGETIINGELRGKNKIDAGIGSVNIDLTDEISNYTFEVSKGIGSIKIDGKEISDNTKYGIGDSYIEINGGIGSIEIK